MKKLYHIYNEKFEIITAKFFSEGEQPHNAIYIEFNNFIKPMVDITTNTVYEGASSEYINHVKLSTAVEKETEKYIQRIRDGQEKYAELSAEFRLAKLSGQITEETHSAIEEILIPVRNEVLAGQWMSALTKLEGIGSALIGENLYNRLHNDVQTYINNSYTVEEILNRHG